MTPYSSYDEGASGLYFFYPDIFTKDIVMTCE